VFETSIGRVVGEDTPELDRVVFARFYKAQVRGWVLLGGEQLSLLWNELFDFIKV